MKRWPYHQVFAIPLRMQTYMETNHVEPGTRVRVRGCRRRPALDGLEGTVRQRLGGDRYVAFEVWLDGGERELFWPHELEERRKRTLWLKR